MVTALQLATLHALRSTAEYAFTYACVQVGTHFKFLDFIVVAEQGVRRF
jgi:hypothetical protein